MSCGEMLVMHLVTTPRSERERPEGAASTETAWESHLPQYSAQCAQCKAAQ